MYIHSSFIKHVTNVLCFNSQTINALKEDLNKIEVDYVEKRFRTEEGPSGIITDLFVSLSMYIYLVCANELF